MAGNVLYVEGKSLDDFLLGHLGLVEVNANKVGTFVDPTGIGNIDDVINTLNAARAAKGIDCGLHTVLARGPGIEIEWSRAGCAVGESAGSRFYFGRGGTFGCELEAIGGVSVIQGVTWAMFARHLDGESPN